MARIAIITDTHAGARNNSLIFNQHFLKFYTDVFFPYLKKNKIETVVHLGDLFDVRVGINFRILSSWRQTVFSFLSKEIKDFHVISGNHDLYHKNSTQPNALDELVSHYNNFHIYTKPTEVNFGSTSVLFVPWICEENADETFKAIAETECEFLWGHLEIKGFLQNRARINTEHGFDAVDLKKFTKVFSGHYHQKSDDGKIFYLSTPYEMDWSDYGCPHGFHIWDTEEKTAEYITNPHTIFERIVYDDSQSDSKKLLDTDYSHIKGKFVRVVIEKKEKQAIFNAFLTHLSSFSPAAPPSIVEKAFEFESPKSDDSLEEIGTKDILTIFSESVEEMDLGSNKDLVLDTLNQLYIKALEQKENLIR